MNMLLKTGDGGSIKARLFHHLRLTEQRPEPESSPIRLTRPSPPVSPTIFHEPWWLQIASRGECREVIVESGSRLAGRLPFVVRRRMRSFDVVGIPDLTHCLGPALNAEFAPPAQ